jgi:hypothetical protein
MPRPPVPPARPGVYPELIAMGTSVMNGNHLYQDVTYNPDGTPTLARVPGNINRGIVTAPPADPNRPDPLNPNAYTHGAPLPQRSLRNAGRLLEEAATYATNGRPIGSIALAGAAALALPGGILRAVHGVGENLRTMPNPLLLRIAARVGGAMLRGAANTGLLVVRPTTDNLSFQVARRARIPRTRHRRGSISH